MMSLAILVTPGQVTSRVALSDLIEHDVTKEMENEKPRELIPVSSVPDFLWSWNKQKCSKDFWELAMFIIFKEIIRYTSENC